MTDTAAMIDSQHILAEKDLDRIHEAARAAASWDVVPRPATVSSFPKRVLAAHRALKVLEQELASLPTEPPTGTSAEAVRIIALQELRANPRMLRSAITAVSSKPAVIARLPRVVLPADRDEPRAATVAELYFRTVKGEFFGPSFTALIRALQEYEPLALDELWNIASFLKFALLESLLDEAHILLHSPEVAPVPLISARIKSLRTVANTDWVFLIEPLIVFDATLRQDPAGVYASMEFESRELYRKRVAFVARHSNYSESQVAQGAINLARQCEQHPTDDPRIQRRRLHVGYYLVDSGFTQLATRTEFHPRLVDRIRMSIRAHPDDFYITAIEFITVIFIAAVIFPLLPNDSVFISGLIVAFLLLLLPATQCAVDLVNNTVTSIFDPEPLPKLDFSKGIPAECTTLVAVPTLLIHEEQVRGLVTDLEIRFLANRDPNLHFALLTDLADSVSKPRENDSHALVDLALQLINDLNAKYGSLNSGSFLLLHRHRIFNVRQGVWMGWERKRGKLLDLNKLLVGEYDAFPVKAGNISALRQVRYILTLDSDTQVPRGVAARLIGAIAHPLNQAIIDPKRRIVVAGYGILQPRVGVSVHAATRSRLATIYSGQSGFDIYSRAISDAYQDLYGEGSFTGKGIYEVATLHAVLDRRFPRNSLLSHDLIEGAYARAGLATDIEVIDDYPSHLSAYTRRKHRWVRGDWQIAQWMFSRVPDESGHWGPSPISTISRWKILDNLRRSLVEPFTFILFLAGWLGLPGGPLYWTIVPLILFIFPTLVQLGFGIGRTMAGGHKGSMSQAMSSAGRAALVALLNLVFLPHQTLLAVDAIVRSLVRRFITGERLLEWETAAESESQSPRRTPVDRYLSLMPLVTMCVAIVVYLFAPSSRAILIAAPILLLWGLANVVTTWLNAQPREQNQRLSPTDKTFLLGHALRIWRYFHQFGAEGHNYLIPDNVEEEGLFEAARVSPTNLGLLLNARQAACEFGFLTAPEFVALTSASLVTMERLEKYRGHLYNWYDTKTCAALNADPFVSSVDSGNFVASLYTLHAGARDLLRKPLLSRHLFTGLRAYWQMDQSQKRLVALPAATASITEWIAWLPGAAEALSSAPDQNLDDPWWSKETAHRVTAILALLRDYTPWLLPEYAPLRKLPHFTIHEEPDTLSIEAAPTFSETLGASLASTCETLNTDSPLLPLAQRLRALLPGATGKLQELVAGIRAISHDAERLAEETDFTFLADPDRQILSIGFDMGKRKVHEACYDMLASEARIATFIAVARGDLPQQSWFKLGRDYARAFGQFVLLSWTGTMFEYLMPSLWMRSYPDTLVSRTLSACVHIQRSFAGALGIPWGISESGGARKDEKGHYHYQAYGVPEIALWFEATAGPVISPYSTFLALGVDSEEAIRNLRRMASLGWVGPFGFYESADYSASTRNPVVVREWMAHHQGMALLAVLNCLRNNIVQRWFHANPVLQSTELLLHEMPVDNAILKAMTKDFAPVPIKSKNAA